VQTTLEGAILAATQENVRVIGAGRTDAGAHALCQVVAFDTCSVLSPEILLRAVNAHLPRDIAVTSACRTHATFHPRYDAISRVYRYLIFNRPVRSPMWERRAAHLKPHLDVASMDQAAQQLRGRHDFSAFTGVSAVSDRSRMMYAAGCRRDDDLVTLEFEAQGFMRQMVRSLAGTLVEVGLGKLSIGEFVRILRTRDRMLAGRTMPARGLYLVAVKFRGEGGEITTDEAEGPDRAEIEEQV
jgi:tRNA pseudouridine38-40 synthase